MVEGYKGKVSGYETLILKMTTELENYLRSNGDGPTDYTNKSVISLYETKITSLHSELSTKKQQYRDTVKQL